MKMDLYYFEKGHNSMIVDTDKVLCYNTLKMSLILKGLV